MVIIVITLAVWFIVGIIHNYRAYMSQYRAKQALIRQKEREKVQKEQEKRIKELERVNLNKLTLYQIDEEYTQLYYQLELLKQLGDILESNPSGKDAEKTIKARIQNEKNINSTLRRLHKLEKEKERLT